MSSVVFATAPFLYIFISAWWQLILVRFYHGFATAIFIPVARATIAEYFPSKRGERISTFISNDLRTGHHAVPWRIYTGNHGLELPSAIFGCGFGRCNNSFLDLYIAQREEHYSRKRQGEPSTGKEEILVNYERMAGSYGQF